MHPSVYFLCQFKGKWIPDVFNNISNFSSYIFPEHPILTLDSQQNIYAFEGMDVFFEAQVKAYPYPWVSLSHVLESNKRENAVGNDTVTVRLYVEGKFILLTCTH